uniref:Uncharacterized protein n=1 Tax=Anguilla anguilla TaxID=7936 RepID=A0A0E9PRQ2_ANGAN
MKYNLGDSCSLVLGPQREQAQTKRSYYIYFLILAKPKKNYN